MSKVSGMMGDAVQGVGCSLLSGLPCVREPPQSQCLPGLQREEIDHNKKCQRDLINEDEDNIVDCGTSVQIKHMKELPL